MLDTKDLEAIKQIMQDTIHTEVPQIINEMVPKIIDERVPKIIDERVPKIIDERVPKMIDKKLARSENMILTELDRVQIRLEKKFDHLQKEVQELQQYYRITKLEQENTNLLLRLYTNLEHRVENLEQKLA